LQILSYKAYVEGSPYRASFPETWNHLARPLDLFLQYFGSREPDLLKQVYPALLDRLRGFASAERSVTGSGFLPEAFAALEITEEHRQLLQAQVDLQCGLLEVADRARTGESTINLSKIAFIRAQYLPQYLQLKALADASGKARGTELMKACLDWEYMKGPSSPDAPGTIDELRIRQVEGNLRGEGMDWIAAVISEHEYRNKVTTCAIQKALAKYGDSELMEVVACYPDFTMFRKLNPNFCLTRTTTLMGGGDCCDMCYHDERYVPDFAHPSAEVFEAMQADVA